MNVRAWVNHGKDEDGREMPQHMLSPLLGQLRHCGLLHVDAAGDMSMVCSDVHAPTSHLVKTCT